MADAKPSMTKVLVANRGEIACRVFRSASDLGMKTVAVYSDADAQSRHVAMADEKVHIGGPAPAESYLRTDAILKAALDTKAQAIHPGYGFLSENAEFAREVRAAGLIWVGPDPETIEMMGDKYAAREAAVEAGVPVLPGSDRIESTDEAAIAEAVAKIGFPLLVKAAGGGGGIGMKRVDDAESLSTAIASTQSVATRLFGGGGVFLERFVENARHIEVQVFGFGDGRVVHLFERECSIQRRFQKIVEESPSPAIDAQMRERLTQAACALAASQKYAGAGTVEFIYDDDNDVFYFLEMNTRIQVEHPVTEMITQVDLVAWQLLLAAGKVRNVSQADIAAKGHAIEFRLCAENPAKKFFPSPGKISKLKWPEPDTDVRIDTGVRQGDSITPYYDPMIAKVIVFGQTREAAIAKASTVLAAICIEGPHTNLSLMHNILECSDFRSGRTLTTFIQNNLDQLLEQAGKTAGPDAASSTKCMGNN
ncbi:MAG: acetyl/propionyl/methylcrotonyl-CoA carboxylase subunit alpha [Novosphingobium sp.]